MRQYTWARVLAGVCFARRHVGCCCCCCCCCARALSRRPRRPAQYACRLLFHILLARPAVRPKVTSTQLGCEAQRAVCLCFSLESHSGLNVGLPDRVRLELALGTCAGMCVSTWKHVDSCCRCVRPLSRRPRRWGQYACGLHFRFDFARRGLRDEVPCA